MKITELIKLSFNKKLIAAIMVILFLSTASVGIVGYFIARESLDKKGEIILKNSVVQAIQLIDTNYELFESGVIEEEEAKEKIRQMLHGNKNEDGTRKLNTKINIGKNGYIMIFHESGEMFMHPTLEGENVLNVVDYGDEDHYLVKEQIKKALNGGGYVTYYWVYPHSENIGKKISYSMFYPKWKWIVTATSYKNDFNAEANKILVYITMFMLGIFLITSLLIIRYVINVTKPIIKLSRGMEKIGYGEYELIDIKTYNDEIGLLVNGYNKMVNYLIEADQNILIQTKRLHYLAYNDELTNMPNRHGFKNYVTDRLEECSIGCMVQMSIIGLEAINSTMGFENGDFLLKIIGDFFKENCSKNCYHGRTSSNEFSIWLEEFETEDAKELVYKIRKNIKNYLENKNFNYIVDMHISMAIYPKDGETFDSLYEKVSMAMRQAKKSNNLMINFYENKMKERIENEILMRKYLYSALNNKEIVAYYQEKINYETMEIVGVEALARWKSFELGIVPPNVFIPALYQLNILNNFTDYMIKTVLDDYEKIIKKYEKEISVSINIPSSYFLDKDFLKKVKNYIKNSNVPPNKLIFEITEDIFIADSKKISRVIEKLHELEIKISIDDFGTGYSSLNYLTNINFDELKIDKIFIDEILENEKVFKLFEILCKIADIYGYEIVAEGVENQAQIDKIKTTSLKIIQGYIYSKPEPLE